MKKTTRIAMLLAMAFCAVAGAMNASADDEVSLTPSFDPETLTYTATVPHDVAEVVLDLAPEHPNATVTVNGHAAATPVQLAVGRNTVEIVVTAEDERNTRTYTVVVTREALSSNADLAGLAAEAATDGAWSALEIGAFDAATTAYAASVPYAATQARLTATAADAEATLKAGAAGSLADAAGGSAGPAIALDVGDNALAVEVTAADGTVKTYAVTVTREAEGEPLTASFGGRPYEHDGATAFRFVVLLSEKLGDGAGKVVAESFVVENGRVDSVREINTDYYYVHVRPDGREDVTVTLRGGRACSEEGAVCAGDGRKLWNSPSMTLTGPPASSDADLSGLTAEAGTDGNWSALHIGAFDADTTAYSASVPYGTTHARLTATASDAAASLAGGAEIALDVGGNTLAIEVTAEDGTTTKTYTVTVTREARALSSNADLSGLTAEAGADGSYAALDIGAFDAATTAYSASVPYATTHARLTATAADANATLTGGGATALEVGANALAVEVTAEDGTTSKTYTVTVERAEPPPLTASFGSVPAAHDAETAFGIDVRFSEALDGGSAPTAASFDVAGGTAESVERVEAGVYRVSVRPKSFRDATVTLAGGRDCAAAGAVCTADGRALENTVAATVGGPARIRIEGGTAREGKDATLDFALSLHRAAAHAVSVDYATADRTATAGADYEAASGTLTFAPGETAATVSVAILDDEVDEGKETFELRLSNARGAYLRERHTKATGTIRNTDRMPAAWLARFGRAATDHVVDALDARFDDASYATEREARLGGASLFGPDAGGGPWAQGQGGAYGAPGAINAPGGHWPGSGAAAPHGAMTGGGSPLTPMGALGAPGGVSGGSFGGMAHGAPQGDVLRSLLLGSSFRASAGDEESGRRLTAWGRAAGSFFAGDDGGLAVEGDATTVMLGADAAWSRWLAGVALARTMGTGSYRGAAGSGELSGTLTAVHPYARFRATDRLSAWGALGWGAGELELETAAGGDWRTPTAMRMAAGGLRGVLLRRESGLELAGRMDARFTRMTSEAVSGETGDLAAATGDASRLRLLLEGSRPFALDARRTLTPSVEIGLRQDGGDAETGMGLELGGALRYVDAQLGLAVDLAGRRLAAHADGGYEEWGASASVTLDPGASGRGLSLTLTPAWGAQAMGGAERLWSMTDARSLATGRYQTDAGMRLAGDVAYGFDAFGGKGAMAPFAGMASSGYGRDWRAGVRWTVGPAMEFGFEATRSESALARASHGLLLRFAWRPGTGLAPMRGGARQPDGSAAPDGAEALGSAPH